MDKPFTQNLDECLRYYQKSNAYGTLPNAATGGLLGVISASNVGYMLPSTMFLKRMAKVPTLTIYDSNNGNLASVYNISISGHAAVSSAPVSDIAIQYINLSTNQAAGNMISFNYAADTGW
jgi:hypothetical protein